MEFLDSIRLLETLFAFRISIIMLLPTEGSKKRVSESFLAFISCCLPTNHRRTLLTSVQQTFETFFPLSTLRSSFISFPEGENYFQRSFSFDGFEDFLVYSLFFIKKII